MDVEAARKALTGSLPATRPPRVPGGPLTSHSRGPCWNQGGDAGPEPTLPCGGWRGLRHLRPWPEGLRLAGAWRQAWPSVGPGPQLRLGGSCHGPWGSRGRGGWVLAWGAGSMVSPGVGRATSRRRGRGFGRGDAATRSFIWHLPCLGRVAKSSVGLSRAASDEARERGTLIPVLQMKRWRLREPVTCPKSQRHQVSHKLQQPQ